jgi:hypothetical protein
VLEIGCGTGQLTRSLLARGLRVTAIEPGEVPRPGRHTLGGVGERCGNVSEVWAWLGGYELARGYAADMFDDAQVAVLPTLLEHTADALNALLGTMSFWARLSRRQRDHLCAENHALHQRLGRPIRSSTVACLVTARRVQKESAGGERAAGRGWPCA